MVVIVATSLGFTQSLFPEMSQVGFILSGRDLTDEKPQANSQNEVILIDFGLNPKPKPRVVNIPGVFAKILFL